MFRKAITKDPVTHRKCGHTFEKEIVNRFLENSAKKKVGIPDFQIL